MVYACGNRYEGEWSSDTMHGIGRFTFADTGYFEGEFAQGCKVKGVYVSALGDHEYDGEWKDEKRHGYGPIRWDSM